MTLNPTLKCFKTLLSTLFFFQITFIYSQAKNPFLDIESYLVRIYQNENQIGTGFSYRQGEEEYIVTNYHVIKDHIEKLKVNDTTSKIFFLPATELKDMENGIMYRSANNENARYVQLKKILLVPDSILKSEKIQNYAKSVDLIALIRKKNDTLISGPLKSFDKIKFTETGDDIYCASFPLSSYQLQFSKGVASKTMIHILANGANKQQEISKKGFSVVQFLGYGDYVAASGSSGAPVFMINESTNEKILVGINRATTNPFGEQLQDFAKKYSNKLDSINKIKSYNDYSKSDLEILEKFLVFYNAGVSTIGINQFVTAQSLAELIIKLTTNR